MRKKIVALILLMVCSSSYGETFISQEALKAAFIYHFINFTQWNDDLPDYYVCIPEDRALKEVTAKSFQNKIVNNRKIIVTSQYDTCHILVSDHLSESPAALTIGQLDKGALIEFRLVNNKLKFAVNVRRIKSSELKISSQLLKLAILEGQ